MNELLPLEQSICRFLLEANCLFAHAFLKGIPFDDHIDLEIQDEQLMTSRYGVDAFAECEWVYTEPETSDKVYCVSVKLGEEIADNLISIGPTGRIRIVGELKKRSSGISVPW